MVDREKDTILDVSHEGNSYQIKVNPNSFFDNLRNLKINGKTQCGTGRLGMVTTSLTGGLPVILGKQGDALIIGLGCGVTLGVLEKGNFENIDTVEIDPIVVEAAEEFNDINNDALDDPRSNIIIDDARNYLLKTDKKYGAIVAEATLPYERGSSNLFTKEFFSLMKEHLKDDGIAVQYLPVGLFTSCDEPGFAIFYKTFSSVFPNVHVFISKTSIPTIRPYFTKDDSGKIKADYKEIYDNPVWKFGEIILIGSLEPIDIEKYLDGFNETVLADYFEQIRIFDLRDHYMFSSEDVAGFSSDVVLNTDNNPILEFIAAKALYTKQQCKVHGIEFTKEKVEEVKNAI